MPAAVVSSPQEKSVVEVLCLVPQKRLLAASAEYAWPPYGLNYPSALLASISEVSTTQEFFFDLPFALTERGRFIVLRSFFFVFANAKTAVPAAQAPAMKVVSTPEVLVSS